ncbi:MAG: GIY-YIG nuclease family protein [Defluviitaleaceae bacterium]|nr:GIY-YIG nuclease family protein [Defluviitaleaceae bacterium]
MIFDYEKMQTADYYVKPKDDLVKAIRAMPLVPGCYLFIGKDGQVLYVGKSKCLRKRASSYLGRHKDEKITKMMRLAANVRYETTDTDIEAMLLEYKLIKNHLPPFNAKMRKEHPHWYINIDTSLPYPKLYATSEEMQNPMGCVGPFSHQENATDTMMTIGGYWKIPVCRQGAKKPCMQYHTKQCLAPCICKISEDTYAPIIESICAFFRGDYACIFYEIEKAISAAANEMAFEKAARLRDQYKELHHLSQRINRMPPELDNKNYCCWLKSYHEESLLLVYIENRLTTGYMRFKDIHNLSTDFRLTAMQKFISDNEIPKTSDFKLIEPQHSEAMTNALLAIDVLRNFTDVSQLKGRRLLTALINSKMTHQQNKKD